MTSRDCVKLALAAVALAAGMPVAAKERQERVVRDRDPDARDVATTPLRDLNIMRERLPEVLVEAVVATYASEKLADCEDIEREIARLDAALGSDLDSEQDETDRLSMGKLAESAVASFIPFRSVIREISGAAEAQRALREAVVAGFTRRGFLKGLGEARDCAYPARPLNVRMAVDESQVYDMATGNLAVRNEDGSTTTYRRREVVQPD